MEQYLYGASVQGIQSFIFQTGKLREIVGASEIVQSICTQFFQDAVAKHTTFNTENLLVGAAGNIKYLFNSVEECQAVFRDFPREVMTKAPGITFSQGMVVVKESLKKANQELESILKGQRNKQSSQHGLGWMISERSRKTGNPSITVTDEGKYIDKAQFLKRKAYKSGSRILLEDILDENSTSKTVVPEEMNDLFYKGDKGWLAVIHADGNGLGKKLLALSDKNFSNAQYKNAFRTVSENLNIATKNAVRKAYKSLEKYGVTDKVIIRPIVLGGDDLTIIIDGKYSLPFTESFLKNFEQETKKVFSGFSERFLGFNGFENGLTACAGIAFVKPNYPFHYAVSLAENLCKTAKKTSRLFSSLMFHRVQSSYVPDFAEIVKQELSINEIYRFDYGPYFIEANEKGRATVGQLNAWVDKIKEEGAPASSLRDWLTALQTNKDKAELLLNRIKKLKRHYVLPLGLDKISLNSNEKTQSFIHLFDVLTIASINK